MLVPPAMNIETAMDMMKNVPAEQLVKQAREFSSAMGEDKCKQFGLSYPLTSEAQMAYNLGLQTARTIILGSVTLMLRGLSPEDKEKIL